MDRLACVDVPALPLQLLLQREPQWRGVPAVVVQEDKPLARILWVNEEARALRILPGHRYAQALSLASDLRAGVISKTEIEVGVEDICALLRDFTPRVEPNMEEPGIFWLDASGLGRLYPSLTRWATGIDRALRARQFHARVCVGFDRFGTYALARTHRSLTVSRSPDDERAQVARVPLDRLGIDPKFRDHLARLGVLDVGDFLKLPASGIRKRFGIEAHRLHLLASGEAWAPLEPKEQVEEVLELLELDYAERDVNRLLFLLGRRLDRMLAALAARSEALAELHFQLQLEGRPVRAESVRPAAPTLEGTQLVELLRLRLESLELGAGVTGCLLVAEGVRAKPAQLRLFAQSPRRDLEAGNRALARLRAEFGEGVVVRAVLRDGHLPEARYRWEPIERVARAQPTDIDHEKRLVRRILDRGEPLSEPSSSATPPRTAQVPDGWLIAGLEAGAVKRIQGPYVISGGWWHREIHREYHFVETHRGDLLWVYFDRRRRRWMKQGGVE